VYAMERARDLFDHVRVWHHSRHRDSRRGDERRIRAHRNIAGAVAHLTYCD
jgi:hypothetical protein